MGEWVQAKACSSHTCIEVGRAGTHLIAIWTDDLPEHKAYATREEWAAFVQGVKDGDFDDL